MIHLLTGAAPEGHFGGGDAGRAHAERIKTEREEQRKGLGAARDVTTQADGPSGGVGCLHGLPQEAQERGVFPRAEGGGGGVVAVGGEKILGEVVRPDAEKIGVAGQFGQRKDGGGNF